MESFEFAAGHFTIFRGGINAAVPEHFLQEPQRVPPVRFLGYMSGKPVTKTVGANMMDPAGSFVNYVRDPQFLLELAADLPGPLPGNVKKIMPAVLLGGATPVYIFLDQGQGFPVDGDGPEGIPVKLLLDFTGYRPGTLPANLVGFGKPGAAVRALYNEIGLLVNYGYDFVFPVDIFGGNFQNLGYSRTNDPEDAEEQLVPKTGSVLFEERHLIHFEVYFV